MASGHVNRANRPNTWLHRPSLQREVFPCQPGAVHTWHMDVDGDAHGCARRWGPLFGLVLGRIRAQAGTPLFEFLRRRIGVERTES
jgi:hypothetical protein